MYIFDINFKLVSEVMNNFGTPGLLTILWAFAIAFGLRFVFFFLKGTLTQNQQDFEIIPGVVCVAFLVAVFNVPGYYQVHPELRPYIHDVALIFGIPLAIVTQPVLVALRRYRTKREMKRANRQR